MRIPFSKSLVKSQCHLSPFNPHSSPTDYRRNVGYKVLKKRTETTVMCKSQSVIYRDGGAKGFVNTSASASPARSNFRFLKKPHRLRSPMVDTNFPHR